MDTNSITNNIGKLSVIINKTIDDICKKVNKRTRKISFRETFYFVLRKLLFQTSYTCTNNKMKIDINNYNVSESSIIDQRHKTGISYFEQMFNVMNKFIYQNSNDKYRFIAVDGSYIYLSKECKTDGFKLNTNKLYCTGMINGLFDVNKKVPIRYDIFTHFNEVDALISQLKYLNSNSVIIGDRGYCSDKLIYNIYEQDLNFIIRLKKDTFYSKLLDKNDTNEMILNVNINGKNKFLKLVKYNVIYEKKNNKITYIDFKKFNKNIAKYGKPKIINNDTELFKGNDLNDENIIEDANIDDHNGIVRKTYYIATSVLDMNINQLRDTYWNRWSIEVSFKEMKYELSLNNTFSSNIKFIKQDLYASMFIMSFRTYLVNMVEKTINNSYRINKKSIINNIDIILFNILFKNNNGYLTVSSKKHINKSLEIVHKSTYYYKSNRIFIRRAIKPKSKWCYFGCKYGKGVHKKKRTKAKKKTINKNVNQSKISEKPIIKKRKPNTTKRKNVIIPNLEKGTIDMSYNSEIIRSIIFRPINSTNIKK